MELKILSLEKYLLQDDTDEEESDLIQEELEEGLEEGEEEEEEEEEEEF